jgi:hypothetical protein
MPSKNLISNELEFTPTFGTQQTKRCYAVSTGLYLIYITMYYLSTMPSLRDSAINDADV